MAQCCRNIQLSFSKCLGTQKVCLGFKRFNGNVDIKYFFKSKNSEKNKIMIWVIHYFITKLKTKIDVIPRSCFKAAPWDDINFRFYFCTEVVYPTDHVFIFFSIFILLQIFLINISMKPEETQTNYLYT